MGGTEVWLLLGTDNRRRRCFFLSFGGTVMDPRVGGMWDGVTGMERVPEGCSEKPFQPLVRYWSSAASSRDICFTLCLSNSTCSCKRYSLKKRSERGKNEHNAKMRSTNGTRVCRNSVGILPRPFLLQLVQDSKPTPSFSLQLPEAASLVRLDRRAHPLNKK